MKRFLATMGIVGLTFLGATAPANATSEQITICHATGSETHPYEEITINTSGLSAHEDHQWGEDIIPAPAAGCPAGTTPTPTPTPPPGHDGEKVTICHATGSATNPYVIITIDESALPAHRDHQQGEDIIPAPAAGCPTGITPPPGPGPDGKKVTICHATGSTTNPYVIITIDESALPAHRNHQEGEDIIPAPAAGCPAGVPPLVPPKVVPPVVPPGVPPAMPPAGAAAAPPAVAGAARGSVPAMNPGFNAQTAVASEGETGIPAWIGGAALLLTAAGILALRRRDPATAQHTVAE